MGLACGPKVPEMDAQKHQFPIGFISFCDSAAQRLRFTEKPNAFLMNLVAILQNWLQNYQDSTGFIRYSDQLSRMCKNSLTPLVFDDLQSRKTSSTFTEKPNAFWMMLGAISQNWLQNYQNSTGFIRCSDQLFRMCKNLLTPLVFR